MSEFEVHDDSDEEKPDPDSIVPPAPRHVPPAPSAPKPRSLLPEYQEILTGAAWLRAIAIIFMAMGVLAFIIGIYAGATKSEFSGGGIAPFIEGCVNLVKFFAGAMLLKMLAASGEALRDLARNSFKS